MGDLPECLRTDVTRGGSRRMHSALRQVSRVFWGVAARIDTAPTSAHDTSSLSERTILRGNCALLDAKRRHFRPEADDSDLLLPPKQAQQKASSFLSDRLLARATVGMLSLSGALLVKSGSRMGETAENKTRLPWAQLGLSANPVLRNANFSNTAKLATDRFERLSF